MDGITEENNADIRYYSIEGERVACRYTSQDFLECPQTRSILDTDEQDRFGKSIEAVLSDFLHELCVQEQEELSSALTNTTPGKFSGEMLAIIRQAVWPNYDFNMFGREPDLAAPLQAFVETKNK